MIRALGHEGERLLVFLGLDPENVARIREGDPIKVNLRHLDPGGEETEAPDIDVVIFSTTDLKMMTALHDAAHRR